MYQNKYSILAITRATQNVSLDHKGKTLEYGSIEEVLENECYQIYDVTNGFTIGEIPAGADDKEIYKQIHEMITDYETAKQEESGSQN